MQELIFGPQSEADGGGNAPHTLVANSCYKPKQEEEKENVFSNRVVHPVSRAVSYLCSRTQQLLCGLFHPDGPGVSSAGSTSLSCPTDPLLLPTLT